MYILKKFIVRLKRAAHGPSLGLAPTASPRWGGVRVPTQQLTDRRPWRLVCPAPTSPSLTRLSSPPPGFLF